MRIEQCNAPILLGPPISFWLFSGVEKLTRSSLKGVFKQTPFYKNGRFASSLLLLGVGLLQASKKAHLSFRSPSAKPHFNRTGSVFALPMFIHFVCCFHSCFPCFMFLPFCFDVGFAFGMFYYVLVLFLFCFLFCFHRL